MPSAINLIFEVRYTPFWFLCGRAFATTAYHLNRASIYCVVRSAHFHMKGTR